MVARGYTTSALVQVALRRTLTTDELADADRKIEAVEQFLDAWSGQVYTATGTVTDEMIAPVTSEPMFPPPVTTMQLNPWISDPVSQLGHVQLKGTPVGQIVAVRNRPSGTSPNDDVGWIASDSLHPGSFSNGLLTIPGFANYPYVFVTYKSLAGVPAIFTEITTQIVADMLVSGVGATPPPAGPMTSYSLGGDLSMSFASRSTSSGSILAGIPASVWPLLMSIKRWSIG